MKTHKIFISHFCSRAGKNGDRRYIWQLSWPRPRPK